MIGNLILKLITSALVGAFVGLFYTVLLSAHGFKKISYRYITLFIVGLIFTFSFFGTEAAGIITALLVIMVFILAIALFVRGLGSSLSEQWARQQPVDPNTTGDRPVIGIVNYYGVCFHVIVIILICLSIFTYSNDVILNEERITLLIRDAFFQFYSTLMLMAIGIFNPFVAPSARLMGTAKLVDPLKYPVWHRLLADKRSWTVVKTLITILIITYFVSKGYFNLPDWNTGGIYMNGYILLIGIFIFINLLQLIRNPDGFFKRNILRVTMLFRSAFMSLFVAAIMVFTTLFISAVAGIDTNRLKVSSEAILFLGFNIVMAFNEYKIARVSISK
ncbi:hypothetical protein ABIE26_000908 [Pedobacter africanus]|uniref:Uncharacterized protein n=1 Tax=Pedobacter africanus TaxID=151894 RepID=A0ACC6KTE3_9SPHI|nr:hypothetical protein [Pedobacter africanus]MDR6782604.1 hypothetical protein [Pedobacter africanus]